MLKEKLIIQPSLYFDGPEDVLISSRLNNDEKYKALLNWKQTCIQLQNCSTEGMEGGSPGEELQAVAASLQKLESR